MSIVPRARTPCGVAGPPALSVLCSALALAVLCLAVPGAAQTPPLVVLAPAIFYPGPTSNEFDIEDCEFNNRSFSGLQMAAYEINQRGGIHGRMLDVRRYNWSTKDTPTEAEYKAKAALMFATPNLVALAHNAYDHTPLLVKEAGARNITVLSPTAVHGVAWGDTATYTVNMRPRLLEEALQLLQYALTSRFRCKSMLVATFAIADMKAGGDLIVQRATELGLPPPKVIHLGMQHSSVLPRQIMDLAATMPAPPQCYFFILPSFWTQYIVQEIMADPTFGAVDPIFLSTSISTRFSWNHNVTRKSTMYHRVFTSGVFPNPLDTRFLLIRNFRDTSTRAIAAGASDSLAPEDDAVAPQSLEGYITGRFIESALSRVVPASITAATIADVAFTTKMFDIDDVTVGPFIRSCPGFKTAATKTCWCNTGGRSVFMSQVSGVTGHPEPVYDNASLFEHGAAQGVMPLADCGFPSTFPLPSKNVLSIHDPAASAADAAAAKTIGSVAAEFIFKERKAGTMANFFVHPNIVEMPDPTRAKIEALISQRYDTMMVLGSTTNAGTHATPQLSAPTVAPVSAVWLERDPNTPPASQFDPFVIRFWPTLADLAHTAVAFAADRIAAAPASQSTAVHLIADTHNSLALAVKSVETVLKRSPTSTRALSSVPAGASSAALFPASGATALPSDGYVVVVSQRDDVVGIVRSLASSVPQASLLLCTSELLLDAHRPSVADEQRGASLSGVPLPPNLFYTSGLPGYTNASRAAELYGHALGAFAVRVALTAGTADGKPVPPAAMMSALYSASAISAGTVSVQPLSNAPCPASEVPTDAGVFPHPATRCQCNKGLNTFFVLNAADVATKQFSYTHPYCGVAFTPLPEQSSSAALSTTTIAIIAVAGVLLASTVVAVVVVVLLRPSNGRDTTHAPKDPKAPFAMVFTDIQASTTLWARAPQNMGDALDTHNKLIRSLISEHKGYEVKTIGDSFMVAFTDVKKAVGFAVGVQEKLLAHDWGTDVFDENYTDLICNAYPELVASIPSHTWTSIAVREGAKKSATAMWNGLRVRVGVNFGTGDVKFDDTKGGYDYFGTVVNTAARVEGVAHGGQILLTDLALVGLGQDRDAALRGSTVKSLGLQPLRGLDAPVELHQVDANALAPRVFPPLRLDVENEIEENSAAAADDPTGTITGSSKQSDSGSNTGASVQNVVAFASAVLQGNAPAARRLATVFSSRSAHKRESHMFDSDADEAVNSVRAPTSETSAVYGEEGASTPGRAPQKYHTATPGPTTAVPDLTTLLPAFDRHRSTVSEVAGAGVDSVTAAPQGQQGLLKDPLSTLLFVHAALVTALSPVPDKAQKQVSEKITLGWRIRGKQAQDRQAVKQWGAVKVGLMHVAMKVLVAMEAKGDLSTGGNEKTNGRGANARLSK